MSTAPGTQNDAMVWLLNNYNHVDDVLLPVNFFKNGKYKASQRQEAEKSFIKSITRIADYDTHDLHEDEGQLLDDHVVNWATDMMNMRFKCLDEESVVNFWGALAISETAANQVKALALQAAAPPATSKHYLRKRKPTEISQQRNKRKKTQEEADGFLIDSMDCSLGTFIKKKGDQIILKTSKTNYFKILNKNSIIDVTNESEESHMSWFDNNQKNEIWERALISTETKEMTSKRLEEVAELAQKKNFKTALNKIYDMLKNSKGKNLFMTRIYQVIIERHLFDGSMFLRNNMELLSEGDFVVKLWGPLIEHLFLGSRVRSHWGDTVPTVFKHGEGKRPKIDLCLICIGTPIEHYGTSGEFGRYTNSKKYYQDKIKLAIVAKAQLNEIIKTYHLTQEESTRIYINTIQILGTQAEICVLRLVGNGIYTYQEVKSFGLPIAKESFMKDMANLREGLTLLRELTLQVCKNIIYFDKQRSSSVKRMSTLTGPSTPKSKSSGLEWTRAVVYETDEENM